MLRKILAVASAGISALALYACFDTESTTSSKSDEGMGEVRVTFPRPGTEAMGKISAGHDAVLKLVITEHKLDSLSFEWDLAAAPESEVLSIPAGPNVKFHAMIVKHGELTHEGMAYANVKPKMLTHVFIKLLFIRGNVEVCLDAEGMAPNCPDGNPASSDILKLFPEFENVKIRTLMTSESVLPLSPDFIYGSMADGAGLLNNHDGSYTFINNLEADYSVARILFDQAFNPMKGEYILNADATANTAQCSGTLITPEEHGFGPLYLSGGEWGGSSNNVFATDPFRDASEAGVGKVLTAMGQWTVENAVPLGKNAYPGKTVVFIGDDHSDNNVPSGQLGMYVGNQGDLEGGKLYGLKVSDPTVKWEMDMAEGVSYSAEFVELTEKTLNALDAECKAKGVMGFSRLEDVDYRRGSAENNREVYMAVTGRKRASLAGKGTAYGRVYKVVLNETDPTGAATIECVLDGDNLTGVAKNFHSPDNILVTENYAYIQEDPNGHFDAPEKMHFARLYQYNLNTGELKDVLECNQEVAATLGYGTTNDTWELTGMIDVSDIVGKAETFLLMTQNHGWVPADGSAFTDPKANPDVENSEKEGSMLFLVEGLAR